MCPHAVGGTEFVCHVLLLEHEAGLVLIDTGFGLADIADPERIGPARHLLRPRFDPAQTAIRQVQALGHQPTDVRHIILTHMDIDHVGAIGDFPHAQIHVTATEHGAATDPPSFRDKTRYFPQQWAHGPSWVLHEPEGELWQGFESVRPLIEFGDEVALVPLPGHTRGHAGVAINSDDGWLLHAGDSYFHRNTVPPDGGSPTKAPLGVRIFERLGAVEPKPWATNRKRLQQLARENVGSIRIFPAHDQPELHAMQQASTT